MKVKKTIELSTGVKVPLIENLSELQLFYLVLTPIERNMSKDLKEYIKEAVDRYFKKCVQCKKPLKHNEKDGNICRKCSAKYPL
mgnify:CR=1 FL=1